MLEILVEVLMNCKLPLVPLLTLKSHSQPDFPRSIAVVSGNF
jgi:hypothetical protein